MTRISTKSYTIVIEDNRLEIFEPAIDKFGNSHFKLITGSRIDTSIWCLVIKEIIDENRKDRP